MFFSIFFGVLAVLYILNRQRRIRPVPRLLGLRFPIFLGVVGLIDLLSYADTHHPSHSAYLWVLATLIVSGVILGAIRALTVKLWTSNNWVVRQGTGLTMGLWVITLALAFLIGANAPGTGAGNLEASSFLLYLAVTYGVQRSVLHRRATPLWDALGPDAGRRLQVNFGQGPGGGAFFTTFGGGSPGFGPGFGTVPESDSDWASASASASRRNDPTIIDVEVVEDDNGPAELR
jgi:hypothetical protein